MTLPDSGGLSAGDIPSGAIPDDIGLPDSSSPLPVTPNDNVDSLLTEIEAMDAEHGVKPAPKTDAKPSEDPVDEIAEADDDAPTETVEEPAAPAPDPAADRLRDVLGKLLGLDESAGEVTLRELTEALERRVLGLESEAPKQEPPKADVQSQPSEQDVPSSHVDAVLAKYNEMFGEKSETGELISGGFEPAHLQFYKELSSAAVESAMQKLQPTMRMLNFAQGIALAQGWYAAAKAARGDAPVPSFAQAYMMLQKNPKLGVEYISRASQLGQVDWNPMTKIIAEWEASKTPSGEKAGDAAKRDAEAKKLRDLKGQLRPGAVKPKSEAMTDEQMESLLATTGLHQI